MKHPRNTSVQDVQFIALNQVFTEGQGSIVFCEEGDHVPFSPKRVYYLYDVPNQAERGGHAHRALQQVLIALSGAFDVVVNDGEREEVFRLSQPNEGLYFPAGLWRELKEFSGGAICLVLASHVYEESDYIRDRNAFDTWKRDSTSTRSARE